MEKRLDYIDAIRGLAIILVVMGHAIAWNYSDWTQICIFKPSQPANIMTGGCVWQIIYSFHMALFFMVSGYLSGNSEINKNNFYKRLNNKCIRLLIPYIVTGFLIYFIRGHWGYWFLLSLFEMAVLWIFMTQSLQRINPNKNIWIDIVFLLGVYFILRVLTIVVHLNYRGIDFGKFILYYIPFCFGAMMKRHLWIEITIRKSWWFTSSLVAFTLLFSCRYITSFPIIYQIVEKADFFLSILALLACTLVFHVFMNGIEKKKEFFLVYLGKMSLPIYILHILFVPHIHEVGYFILHQNTITSITIQILYSIILSSISITLCVCCYKFLSKSPLLKLLMFGEKK